MSNGLWSKEKIQLTLYLPVFDNDGFELAVEREEVKRQLGSITGGYTEIPGAQGFWIDNGQEYKDDMTVLVSTFDADREDIATQIREQIRPWCDMLRQESLYTIFTKVLDISQQNTAREEADRSGSGDQDRQFAA